MRRSHAFAGWVLALACAGRAVAAQASIELLPQAHVDACAVTLGQIARLRSDDLALIRALVDLPVGRAPAAGQSLVVQREALGAWVRQRLRVPAELVWQGASQARVSTTSRSVSGDLIASAAGAELRQWLAQRTERSEVQVAWPPRDIDAPQQGALQLRARSLGGAAPRSRMTVWVDVWAADRFVRTVPVSFSVSAWRTVTTAAAAMPMGAAVGPTDLLSRQVDLTREAGAANGAAPMAGEPMGLRRGLAAGEVLRARDVAPMPVVQRGQWAALRSDVGVVVSEARVEVLQDGRIGEHVRVRQPGAAAQVVARVLGPGQLEIVR